MQTRRGHKGAIYRFITCTQANSKSSFRLGTRPLIPLSLLLVFIVAEFIIL